MMAFVFSILPTILTFPIHLCLLQCVFFWALLFQYGKNRKAFKQNWDVMLIGKAECKEKLSHIFSSDQMKMSKWELPKVFWKHITEIFLIMYLFICFPLWYKEL